MKPDAPDGIRGEFKPIQSSQPGLIVTEHLPRFAKVIGQFAQVRSVHHRMKNHNSATYYSLTGHAPPLDDIRLRDTQELYPSYGSIVARFRPAEDPAIPTFVSYPARPPRRQRHARPDGQLPRQGVRPVLRRPGPERARLPPPRAEPAGRACRWTGSTTAAACSRMVDEQADLLGWSSTARGIDAFYDRALTMLASPKVKAGVRPLAGAGQAPRRLRPDHLRPELPAGPPAGRGGRPVRHGLLLRHRSARATPAAGTPTATTSSKLKNRLLPDHRPDRPHPDRGPGGPRPARRDPDRLDGRVRPLAQGRPTPPSSAPTAATTGPSATPS